MSSTPGNKRGLLDPLVPMFAKRQKSRPPTPDPSSHTNNVDQSLDVSSEAPQMQPATTVPPDRISTPPPTIADSIMGTPAPPLLQEPSNATGSGVATAQKRSTDGPLLKRVGTALQAFRHGAGAFPPLQATIDDVISCFETLKTHEVHRSIEKQTNVIKKRRDQPSGRKLAKAAQDQHEVLSAYRGIERAFRQLQTDAGLSVWSIVEKQATDSFLEKLTPSRLAAHNSTLATDVNRRSCTKHTRAQILLELDQWSTDHQTPNIYWMSGMAGTGKTTIAYTFAESLKARGLLGASFFCTRTSSECQDVGRIIPTIAYQIARYSMSFQSAVVKALENDPDIGTRAIAEQCERLIKEPLGRVKDNIPDGLVVVIDALDECSSANGVGTILDVLFRVGGDLPVKFFVTSRPEPGIRHRVEARCDQSRLMCMLHDIEKSLVEADIELYLHEELANSVSESDLRQLAKLSGSFFIYAATAIRYVRQTGTMVDPDRLEAILGSSSNAGHRYSEIDRLYTTILDYAVNQSGLEPQEQQQIYMMLWTAVCTREPVNIDTLAALTGIKPTKAKILLQPLYSVLHVSQTTKVITTLHASFPDFIFDETRSAKFYCDEARHSQTMAEQCFEVMRDQLRFNICGLESSFITDNEVQDLEARITRSIPPTLSYASHHWGYHVVKSEPCEMSWRGLEDFLSHRLLFWMEVLSLKRTLDKGLGMLSALKPWVTAHGTSDLITSMNDSWIFVSKYAAGSVSQSTPHIYISALAFCHHSSSVYKKYWGQTRGLLNLQGPVMEQSETALLAVWWTQSYPRPLAFHPDGSRFAVGFGKFDTGSGNTCHVDVFHAHSGVVALGPLKGHSRSVLCIVFSPDGSLLASGTSGGTILVWDAHTGNLMYDVIQGHTHEVTSLYFSPDGKHLLSGSDDQTTRMWDSGNGSLIPNSIKHHHSRVNCTAFSPDGKRIACGLDSDKCPIVVYNAFTGESLPLPFNDYQSSVHSIAFPPNGKHLVSGHSCGNLCVWSLDDGTTAHSLLKVHNGAITSIGVSPLGRKLVTASRDRCMYVWDVENGYSNPCLLGTHDHVVTSVAFSLDGTRVASCSFDRTVKMWNALHSTTHTPYWEMPTKTIRSVAISPDASRIAAAGRDKAIYIFNAHDGTPALEPLVAHNDSIYSVAFSPDGRYLVSGGAGNTICLWDSTSGKLLFVLLWKHEGSIQSVSFSPDSRRIVSINDDTPQMWNVGDGTLTPTDLIGGHTHKIHSATFSPDSERVAFGCGDGRIRIWDLQTMVLVFNLSVSLYCVSIGSVTFSPDGRFIASQLSAGDIRVFDSHSRDFVTGPLDTSQCSVVFSTDSSQIVYGSRDGSVRVWMVEDGVPACKPLEGHQSRISSVAYSPDGAYIVSASEDSTIRVWKAPGRRPISSSSQYDSSILDQREPHAAIASGLKIGDDGWARNRDSQLLFWVPSDMVKLFPQFRGVYTIAPEGILRVDYDQPLLLGEEWHRCYVG
ncbi:WD domain, G-beta repeat [Rhizoctonia solani]|uniref:WD domain, G-beta repeat n=1 Tax=Rhizoctonia solani TaxID=456999 RepID=A0A8H7LHH2_9AGAM|nr:WD domain, G-beta repeat [Rhizoctonia solani]